MKIHSIAGMSFALAAMITSAAAITIDGTAPKIQIVATVPAQFKDAIETKMNDMLATSFNQELTTARNNLAVFGEQKDLAQGFANANAYSMNSATLQGFQNYDLFAVAAGMMVGLQAPSTNVSYYSKIAKDIKKKGDLYAGLGLGLSYFNLGINAKLLMPGLYLNVKYGGMKMDFGDFGFDFKVMGVGFNYRLLDSKSLVGLIKWRGISLGSGFYYQSNSIKDAITVDSITNPIPFRDEVINSAAPQDQAAYGDFMDKLGYTAANPNANMALVPSFNMGLDVKTMTIPFDASTAVSLLWGLLNVNAGVGFDLNFGSDKITLKGLADASTSSDTTKVKISPASVSIDGSSNNGPSVARLRFMTGLGLGLGPVKIDVPLIYYPSSGLAFGLTAMVVW